MFLTTERLMYARLLRKAEQTRRFTISDTSASGWEVREEENSHIVRQVLYNDWHRVERAMMAFALRAHSLQDAGWTEAN
jgi:hypothetical protein